MFSFFTRNGAEMRFWDFVDGFKIFFESQGFSFQKEENLFYKEIGDITLLFEFDYVFTSEMVEFGYGIGIPKLEEIHWKAVGKEKAFRFGYVLHVNLKGVVSMAEKKWTNFLVPDRKKFQTFREGIIQLYKTYTIPFFSKYSSLIAVEHLINRESLDRRGQASNKYQGYIGDVLFHGIILAYLMKCIDAKEIKKRNLRLIERECGLEDKIEYENMVKEFEKWQ